ncbi:MAG: cysteine--tRNA ligase [Alphaproteobacteria bacterium]|nr:cysteine--tRNA ligase [Alphaproteobacteria bacterium]
MLRLRNTLSGRVEEFIPVDSANVRMYVCGPTVYDRAHIGNARPAVVFDVLFRILRKLYSNVTYVRNITDVDDKIYKAAQSRGIGIAELTGETIAAYHNDMAALNVLSPTIEPRATEHIPDIIEFIQQLIYANHAYVSNFHVYFDVASFPEYGRLSKKKKDELLAGARVDVSEFKRNPLDFVLWKPADESFNFGWDSPWGIGRPGWHIECSAMSRKYLGGTFDIHGGGIDLVFPHHENEIAQSGGFGCSPMARFWVHNGHLNINGIKMSKSLGNFLTVHDLLKKFPGEVLRLTFLMTHYASPMNFSFDALTQAKNILDRWYIATRDIATYDTTEIMPEVFDALLDDMNTPLAISLLSTQVDELNKAKDPHKAATFLNTCRSLLGIMHTSADDWFCDVPLEQRTWIEEKIRERNEAKLARDYAKADAIRTEVFDRGFLLEDTKTGTTWKKRD